MGMHGTPHRVMPRQADGAAHLHGVAASSLVMVSFQSAVNQVSHPHGLTGIQWKAVEQLGHARNVCW